MILPAAKSRLAASSSILSTLAVALSLIALLLLGTRQFISFDLGNLLAFGETFFETGTIVDYTPFIYTLPPPDTPEAKRPEPGPGSWYDSEGRYRFTNASWLSQIFIYGFWRLAGAPGLTLLQLLLIAGLAGTLIGAMRKYRIPSYLQASTLLLIGLIIDYRLDMRPELFGYLCLMVHYLMLARLSVETDRPKAPSWSWMAGMAAVQLACINLHSYYLLDLALVAAVLLEYLLYASKMRFFDKNLPRFYSYWAVSKRLAATLVLMMSVSFVNPWGWRMAALPFQTLLYMKKYGIGGGTNPSGNSHPYAHIVELQKTIRDFWPSSLSDYGVLIMLILAATAAALQMIAWFRHVERNNAEDKDASLTTEVFRIRWAHLLLIAGMVAFGLQVQRNTGVASLIIVPSALLCITESCRFFPMPDWPKIRQIAIIGANLSVIGLSVFGGYQIVSGQFYEEDRLPTRFGFGISNTMLPIGAADWLNEYAPEARIWCDFNSSSTLRFFTHPHKDLPILTNTWAYPPVVFAENRFFRQAKAPFRLVADRYKINAVVLRADWSLPLHNELAADPTWKMVQVEGVYVLYLRASNGYSALAQRHEIRAGNFDADAFVAREVAKDPSFRRAILSVSSTLNEGGQLDLAIEVVEAGLRYLPPNLMVWETLMNLYSERGARRQAMGDKRFLDDGRRLNEVMQKIVELDPAYFQSEQ